MASALHEGRIIIIATTELGAPSHRYMYYLRTESTIIGSTTTTTMMMGSTFTLSCSDYM
jgi:hypothetical protein